jgi:hypothetical protein
VLLEPKPGVLVREDWAETEQRLDRGKRFGKHDGLTMAVNGRNVLEARLSQATLLADSTKHDVVTAVACFDPVWSAVHHAWVWLAVAGSGVLLVDTCHWVVS